MELKLKPYHTNLYPLSAILIKHQSIANWIKEIQLLNLSFQEIDCYSIPGTIANSVYGCLVILKNPSIKIKNVGKNNWYQCIHSNIYIPENSILYPAISNEEIEFLFKNKLHFLHPEIGLVELEEPIKWNSLMTIPASSNKRITKPADSLYIPSTIHSFQIKEIPVDDILKNMEENLFPKNENIKDEKLSIWEKIKLAALKPLFKESAATPTNSTYDKEPPKWLQKMLSLFPSEKLNNWANKMQQNYDDLENRNKSEVDKLLDMLKKNPEEGLKHAIPIDNNSSIRGGIGAGAYIFAPIWATFALFGKIADAAGMGGGSNGRSIQLPDSHVNLLNQQYHRTAEEMIKNKQHEKAAFIYMKLLKNNYLAAQTLEDGKLYPEAATVYLKYLQNKNKAAECFEKGRMINQAIELYKELNNDEKVGDLYLSIYKKKEAYSYFEKVINNYKQQSQFVKASLIYRNKMDDTTSAQSSLLEGWRSNKDANQCLNYYFSNIQDKTLLENEIQAIYETEVSKSNQRDFLNVIKNEYHKHADVKNTTRDIAYEIIADILPKDSSIATELNGFNEKDINLVRDIIRYKNDAREKKKAVNNLITGINSSNK